MFVRSISGGQRRPSISEVQRRPSIKGGERHPARKSCAVHTSWEDEEKIRKFRAQRSINRRFCHKPQSDLKTYNNASTVVGDYRVFVSDKLQDGRKRGAVQFDRLSTPVLEEEKGEIDDASIPRLAKGFVQLAKPRITKRLNIRVCGHLFQTHETTLNAFPTTLLGKRSEREKYYDEDKDEFIFDRCCFSFDAILFYYQSRGILSRPADVTRDKFLEELNFFQIHQYFDLRHKTEITFLEKENKLKIAPPTKYKEYIWHTFCFRNDPRVMNFFYIFYTGNLLLSVAVTCIEPSIPLKPLWSSLETFLALFFSLEFFTQLYIARERKCYLSSPFGIMDLFTMISSQCSLLSYFAELGIEFTIFSKYFRLIRLFKCTKISRGLQEFLHVFYACREQLTSFIITILIACFISSALVQICEENFNKGKEEVEFMDWLWYSFITASGVGYGDIYPNSIAGKICGAALSVIGVLIFCLPASQIIGKFVELYYLPDTVGDNIDINKKKLVAYTRNIFLGEAENVMRY